MKRLDGSLARKEQNFIQAVKIPINKQVEKNKERRKKVKYKTK